MSFVSLFILFSVDESNGSIYPHFYLGFSLRYPLDSILRKCGVGGVDVFCCTVAIIYRPSLYVRAFQTTPAEVHKK